MSLTGVVEADLLVEAASSARTGGNGHSGLVRVSSRTAVAVSKLSRGLLAEEAEKGTGATGGGGGGGAGRSTSQGQKGEPAERRVGGMASEIMGLRELLTATHLWPAGLPCPAGLLLHGPPGVGKTLLVQAVADECGVPISFINGPDVYSSQPGESEEALRRTFLELRARLSEDPSAKVAAVFIDEIDALCPKRDAVRLKAFLILLIKGLRCIPYGCHGCVTAITMLANVQAGGSTGAMEARVVATLLTLMDGVDALDAGEVQDTKTPETNALPDALPLIDI